MEAPQEEPFDCGADERNAYGGADERQNKAAGELHDCETDITADQIERAMGQVQNLHQPVDERKSGREQEQQHSERDAVERLNHPDH